MYTLRCTRRLLRRLPLDLTPSVHGPSTTLGDWYANVLYIGRAQLVLCTSERSLLTVLVPAKGPRELPVRLRDGVGVMLSRLRVPAVAIRREIEAMSDVLVGRTVNRSVLGSMNDIAKHCRWAVEDRGGYLDLEALGQEMAEMPMLTMECAFPGEMARRLLGAT
jgi:hypothetical protein